MICLLRLCNAVPALQVCIGMSHLEIGSLLNGLIINVLHEMLYCRCAYVSASRDHTATVLAASATS